MLILLVPVSIGVVLYNKTGKILIENVDRSNLVMLEQVTQVVDSHVKEVNQLAWQITQNPKLPELLNMKETEQSEDLYRFIEFIRALSNYQNINSYISDFYVYLPKTDTILSPSMRTDSRTFFNNIYNYEDMTYEDYMKNILSSYHDNSFLPSQLVGQNKHMITFIQSLPIGEKIDKRGTLVILIDEQKIRNMVNNIGRLNNGIVTLYSDKKQVLMTTAENSMLKLEKSEAPYNYYQEDMVITYSPKSQYGWYFLIAVPKKIVLSQVTEIKTWAILFLLLCLFVGIAASYYFAYKNYRPLRDFVQEIIKRKSMTKIDIENDYEFIKATILNFIDNEKNLINRLSKQVPIIQSDFLSKLLKGHIDIDELNMTESDLNLRGVKFVEDYFRVIIIDINDLNYIFGKDKKRELALIRFVICNVSKDLLQESGHAIEMESDRIVILINQSGLSINLRYELDNFVEIILNLVERRMKASITIAISQSHKGIENINRCYNEALVGTRYKMIFGQSSTIYYEDINTVAPLFYYYPIETEIQIINNTKNGDFSNVQKLIDQVYELHFHTNHITPEMGKCLFLDMMGTLFKISGMLNIDAKKLIVEDIDLIQYILNCSTAEEMLKKIKGMFERMCFEVAKAKIGRNEQLFLNITVPYIIRKIF